MITSDADIDKNGLAAQGISLCFKPLSIIYYIYRVVYQIKFMYPANAFIHYVCGDEKIFSPEFSKDGSDDLHRTESGIIGR